MKKIDFDGALLWLGFGGGVRVLVVAIYDMGEEGENGDGGMDEEEKKGENAALVVLLGDGGTSNSS